MSAGRVLVVDDEEIARENLAHALVRAGYEALAVGDTRGALPYSVLVGADGRIERQRLGELDLATVRDWLAPTP